MEVVFGYIEPAFDHGEKFYSCGINSKTFTTNAELKLIGKHWTGKTNNDVHCVRMHMCKIATIPIALAKIFPNLKALLITNSCLKEVSKFELIHFKSLEKLSCNHNSITFLPGDLFEGFENLEFISFEENKLNVIEPNILDGLVNLKHVNFRCRVSAYDYRYPKCFSIYSVYEPNATLDEVKKQLSDKYFSAFPQQKAKLAENSKQILEQQIQKLRSSEAALIQEVKQLRDSESKLKRELINVTAAKTVLSLKFEKGFYNDLKTFVQQDNTFKDFKITIDNREFPVHKFLLAARSPTLAEILQNNPEVENLNLVDISVEIFEKILKFLYTDELPREDGMNFLHLFAAAGKLKIDELKNFAAFKLFEIIAEENAIEILKLSNKYESKELRSASFEKIKKIYPKIKFKDEWEEKSEKVEELVENFKKKEEEIRKLEEEFENKYGNTAEE